MQKEIRRKSTGSILHHRVLVIIAQMMDHHPQMHQMIEIEETSTNQNTVKIQLIEGKRDQEAEIVITKGGIEIDQDRDC